MHFRLLRAFLFLMVVGSLGALACDLSSLSSLGLAQATKPKVTIQSPASGSPFREGDDVSVQSIATDPVGVVRVELAVDGATVRADAPPIASGQTSFTLVQKWKAIVGTHTLTVRAFNASGGASDPALVSVTVTATVVDVPTVVLPTVPLPLGSTPSTTTALPTVPPSGVTPTPAVSPTNRPPTRPPVTPTISAPPGTWALAIAIDPASAKRGVFVSFNVTFLNSTGTPQGYRWFIKIYEPDARNSKGETSKLNSTFPPGTTTLQAPADWKINVSDCTPYIARVYWEDFNSHQVTEFIKPDQAGGPAANFQVCP